MTAPCPPEDPSLWSRSLFSLTNPPSTYTWSLWRYAIVHSRDNNSYGFTPIPHPYRGRQQGEILPESLVQKLNKGLIRWRNHGECLHQSQKILHLTSQSTNKYRNAKRPHILLEAKLEQTHQLGSGLIQLRERQQQKAHQLRANRLPSSHAATFSRDCADTTGERLWRGALQCPGRTCCQLAVSTTTTRSDDRNDHYSVNDIKLRNACLTRTQRCERKQAFPHQFQIGRC